MTTDSKNPETLALHAGWRSDPTTNSVAVPIHQTTSYQFDSTEHAANLFALSELGNIYSRIMNPTCDVLEQRIAALEGGASALACSSGMAAMHLVVSAICSNGDHIVASSKMYGANINLLQHTMPRFGVKTDFVNPNDPEAIENAIKPNTKLVFGEVIGNPGLDIMDVPKIAEICKIAVFQQWKVSSCPCPACNEEIRHLFILLINKERMRYWMLAMFLALLSHPLLDVLTPYGTQLLLPFSDQRFALFAMPIIDPLYTMPLFIGIYLAWRYRQKAQVHLIGITFLVVTTSYLVYGWYLGQAAKREAELQLVNLGIQDFQLESFPTFLQI